MSQRALGGMRGGLGKGNQRQRGRLRDQRSLRRFNPSRKRETSARVQLAPSFQNSSSASRLKATHAESRGARCLTTLSGRLFATTRGGSAIVTEQLGCASPARPSKYFTRGPCLP